MFAGAQILSSVSSKLSKTIRQANKVRALQSGKTKEILAMSKYCKKNI